MCVKTIQLHQHLRGYLYTLAALVTTNKGALKCLTMALHARARTIA